ncbi:MAG TPA: zinc ribbon domain-containing protein [Chitinispirillaceae bacterium]|nr:zinc ribbon domain-containing protein [Chitinispirillaceae bacterium]
MDIKYCQSCVIPLTPDMAGPSEKFCRHCTTPDGTLQSREYVKAGITQFFLMVEPGISQETADKRAEYYMKAMPAWAEK